MNVLLGNGDGTFQVPVSYPVGPLNSVTSVDLNGDGKLDLVTGQSGRVGVLLGNGDGTFRAPVNYTGGVSATSGDFNGDGKLDVVAINRGSVAVLLDTGCLP